MSNSVNHSILWQRGSKLPPCCMKKCFWFLLFSNSWWFDPSLFTASHDTKNFHSLFDLSLLLMILESSLLWLLFAKLILVFVILWNCYNLVFYFFYFLFLRNSYIIFSDLSNICCIMGFQQGNVLEFIANRDAKNSCSSLAWPSLSCVLLLYLSNLLQHSSTGVLLATEKY